MLRVAYAHATDGDLVDETVNPRRLKQARKLISSKLQQKPLTASINALQIAKHNQQLGYKNTREVFDEIAQTSSQQTSTPAVNTYRPQNGRFSRRLVESGSHRRRHTHLAPQIPNRPACCRLTNTNTTRETVGYGAGIGRSAERE